MVYQAERKNLLVIGNGMVGHEFCVQAAKRGLNIQYRITVIGEEPQPAYDRIHLTDCMQNHKEDALSLHPASWYEDQGMHLVTKEKVTQLDLEQRTASTDQGLLYAWDKVVLATGSRPFVPPIPGADLPMVRTYRTIEDIHGIRAACAGAKRAVVIGGGLLGLELAKVIHERGVQTSVIEFSPGLMIRQLNPVASQILQTEVESLGIQVKVSTGTTAITETDGQRACLQYNDDSTEEADLVILATGIRPRDEIMQACDLRCSANGGVIVNDDLETSHPDVYAIGECANHKGTVYGLAAPGYAMAETLAKRLNGGQYSHFNGFDLSTKLKLAGLDVWTVGEYQADGKTVSTRDGSQYRQLVIRRNRLVGATIIGDWSEIALLQDAVTRRAEVTQGQLERFQKNGRLFGDDLNNPVDWPAQSLICTCMQVTRGELTAACNSGCKSVEDLGQETGAGTVCGSCKPLLAKLTGSEIPQEALITKGNKTLLRASLTAAAIVLPFSVYSIPFDESMQYSSGIDILWRDSLIKQISGYTALGLSAVGLLLSLRKRFFAIGNYGKWRAFHGILGTLALIALIAHTGFRLGANLNFMLSISFLGMAILGSVSGSLSALENQVGGSRIRIMRLWWTRAHALAIWAFLPLVIFHIIKVYAY